MTVMYNLAAYLNAFSIRIQPGDRILIQPQYWYQQEQVIEVRGVFGPFKFFLEGRCMVHGWMG